MDAGASKKFLINITRYINPHKFFFKLDNCSESQNNIEEVLAIYGTSHRQHGYKGYVPSIDEIVVVYMQPWNKWIRAKCDYIAEFASLEQKFILWSLDDGVPFLSTKQWIHPMPETLLNLSSQSIFVGGLNNIIPMERQFNMDELRSENVAARDWTELAVKVVNDYMNAAAEIWFEPEAKCGSYCFGSVTVKTYAGGRINLSSHLVKEGLANLSNNFEQDLTQIVTLAKSRWQKNSGLMDDIVENTKQYIERRYSQRPANKMDELDEILYDWSKQNERIRKSTEAECTQHFRQALDELATIRLEVADPFVSTDKSSDKHYQLNVAGANHTQRLRTLRNSEMRQPRRSLGAKSVSNYTSLAKADLVDRDEESDQCDARSVCSNTSTIFTHKKILSRALNSLQMLKIDDSDEDECDQVVAPFKARANVRAEKPINCIPSGHEDDLDAFKRVSANIRNRFVRNRFNNRNNGNKQPAKK